MKFPASRSILVGQTSSVRRRFSAGNHHGAAGRCALPRSGFTLLEVVMAVLLLTIIVGMVFSIAKTSLALGNTIVQTQNQEMEHQAFFDLLNQRFANLPGNARMELVIEGGTHHPSNLTLQNVPMSFSWTGEDRIAKTVQISSVVRRSGFMDVVLRFYENEILEGSASSFGKTDMEKKPFAEIVLLSDVAYFDWRALDGKTSEWRDGWDIPGRLPIQLELNMSIGAQGEPIRQIFWIPPKLNPEAIMRSFKQPDINGNRSGDQQGVNRNTIDDILNNPNRSKAK